MFNFPFVIRTWQRGHSWASKCYFQLPPVEAVDCRQHWKVIQLTMQTMQTGTDTNGREYYERKTGRYTLLLGQKAKQLIVTRCSHSACKTQRTTVQITVTPCTKKQATTSNVADSLLRSVPHCVTQASPWQSFCTKWVMLQIWKRTPVIRPSQVSSCTTGHQSNGILLVSEARNSWKSPSTHVPLMYKNSPSKAVQYCGNKIPYSSAFNSFCKILALLPIVLAMVNKLLPSFVHRHYYCHVW